MLLHSFTSAFFRAWFRTALKVGSGAQKHAKLSLRVLRLRDPSQMLCSLSVHHLCACNILWSGVMFKLLWSLCSRSLCLHRVSLALRVLKVILRIAWSSAVCIKLPPLIMHPQGIAMFVVSCKWHPRELIQRHTCACCFRVASASQLSQTPFPSCLHC